MLEEGVCDLAAHIAGNSHHCEHVSCPLQFEFALYESVSARMRHSLFY
jgi:hypothetical protein